MSILTQFEIDEKWTSVDQSFELIYQIESQTDAVSRVIGHSALNKPLLSLSVGTGDKVCLVTSGVHGTEPASRESILIKMRDICFNEGGKYDSILSKFRIIFIPTINPDGMFRTYRNAENVDINRVSYRLDSPEGIAFMKFYIEVNPLVFLDFHEHSGTTTKDMLYVRAMHLDPNSDSTIRLLQSEFIGDMMSEMESIGYTADHYFDSNTGFGSLTSGLGILGTLAVTFETSTRALPNDRISTQKDNFDIAINWIKDNTTKIEDGQNSFDDSYLKEDDYFVLLQGMNDGAEMYTQANHELIKLPYGYKLNEVNNFKQFIEIYQIKVDEDGTVPIKQRASRMIPHLLDPLADTRVDDATPIYMNSHTNTSGILYKYDIWRTSEIKSYWRW